MISTAWSERLAVLASICLIALGSVRSVRAEPCDTCGRLDVVVDMSHPSQGATIVVDGAPMGVSPSTLWLGVGRHVLRLEKTGFVPVASVVDIARGRTVTLQASLEPAGERGELLVSATAGDAEVAIDGVRQRERTPLLVELPIGEHIVSVNGVLRSTTIEAGVRQVVLFDESRRVGADPPSASPSAPPAATVPAQGEGRTTLLVTSSLEARVFIDGVEYVGAPGGFTVEPGEHVVGARISDGPVTEQVVNVPSGAVTSVHLVPMKVVAPEPKKPKSNSSDVSDGLAYACIGVGTVALVYFLFGPFDSSSSMSHAPAGGIHLRW